jgi:hypothetical protein
MTYKCATCENEFQNGELVAKSSKGLAFHWLPPKDKKDLERIRGSYILDCAKSAFLNNQLDVYQPSVYYEGNFYHIRDLENLPNYHELKKPSLNEHKNGEIIKGNLEGLIKNE